MKDLKQRFIAELRKLVACNGVGYRDEYDHADFRGGRGTMVIARAIANFYEDHEEIKEDEYGNWFHHLNESLVDCIEELRTDPKHAGMRKLYEEEHEGRYQISDIIDSRGSYGGQFLRGDVLRVACLCAEHAAKDYAGSWLRGKLEGYFDAQGIVIHQAWMAFVRKAYRKLMLRIKDERHRGNIGKFGSTELLSYAMAGRVMFSFKRGDNDVTFVADDSDPVGYRSGPNHSATHFCEAVSMINEVTDNWDLDKFVKSDSVNMGF